MAERHSRTWLCSVVFLDIVGYTERAVTQQIEVKQHLQNLVADAVSGIPKSERIMVDTGDGAALCFLGDPEEAMFVALNLRDRLIGEEEQTVFTVRIGINLGPVKVVKSISGQQNPLGDGINNAQRVMSFAKPNQILVSRSFYDVIACLSQEYAQLFQFVGTRKDKHVKEHAVYEVRLPNQEATYATAKAMTEQVEGRKEEEQESPPEVLALTWDPAVLKAAEKDLAPYIGPLAKVLVGRTARQAGSAQDLYRLLGDMIPDVDEREKFLAHAPPAGKVPATDKVGAQAPATTSGSAPQQPRAVSTWDEEVLKSLEQSLAVHVGPLAKL
ncbi:MAG: adenylate/guanylate cyclase domain-containing protein, partial [Gemmatimonadales bacterium]